MLDLFSQSSAVISDCGQYRYLLGRRWGDGPSCVFIMLNPSTADAEQDDRTIGRCREFAKREGCGGLIVVNLFAFRATKPEAMLSAADPVGPENDAYIAGALAIPDRPVIAGWGAWKGAAKRGAEIVRQYPGRLRCLEVTKDGHPKHPLYVKGDRPLLPFGGSA